MPRSRSPFAYPTLMTDIAIACERRVKMFIVQPPDSQQAFDLRKQFYSFRHAMEVEAERQRKQGNFDEYAIFLRKFRSMQTYKCRVLNEKSVEFTHIDVGGGQIVFEDRELTEDEVLLRPDLDFPTKVPAKAASKDIGNLFGIPPMSPEKLAQAKLAHEAILDKYEPEHLKRARHAERDASNEVLPAPLNSSNDKP